MIDIKNQKNKDLFMDIESQAKYIYVYRLFKNGKAEVIYDNSKGQIDKKIFLEKQGIHKLSQQKAFEDKKVVYDWFLTGEKTSFFETTLIPLKNNLGEVESLFCLVKYLERVYRGQEKILVADNTGESFTNLLMKVREEEKRQIASAFHDEVGSNAVLLNSIISILKADIEDNNKVSALNKLQELEDVVQNITKRMRKLIVSVRPPQLREIGLNAAIKDLIESLKVSSDIIFHFSSDITEKTSLSEEVKIVLYRCVQESINNVFKHAKAKNIWVSVTEENAAILITIKDDGVGYTSDKSNSVKKMGLLGMKESVTCIGGTFDIKGKTGKGTLISVRCPKISYVRKVV